MAVPKLLEKSGEVALVKLAQRHIYDLFTAHKMKLSIKDFLSKCDQIRRKLQIWSHLLKKSLMENFIFRVERQTFMIKFFRENSLRLLALSLMFDRVLNQSCF